MPPQRSASFPSYFEEAATRRETVTTRRLARLALALWAAAIYVVYWLAQLGLGIARSGGR